MSVAENKRKALIHCGALIESPEIYPSLTPREVLSIVAKLKGIPRGSRSSAIKEAVEEVKMEDWIDKRVGKFSKGMRQRINLASVLLSRPEIVLLDEPTSGLDPRGMAEVRDMIRSLKQRNRLIFMSSHLLSEVSEVCDEVAMIDHGKLLVYDTLQKVTERFSQSGKVTIEVGFSRPIEDSSLREIENVPGVISIRRMDSSNASVTLEHGNDHRERLLSYLESKKMGVNNFKQTSALEDTYLNLIKDAK